VDREVTIITARESKRRFCSPALLRVLAIGVLALTLLAGRTAVAQVHPDALRFGSVRVGATVEGSLRIFRERADASGLAIKIEAPC
jgi:hypothetical protein